MAKAAKDTRQVADQKTTELACTYAALILHDEHQDITSTQIAKLVNAANIRVEPIWPKVFEKALKGKNLQDLFMGGGAPAQAQAPATTAGGPTPAANKPAAAPVKEEKKPEPEEDMDMGGLFD